MVLQTINKFSMNKELIENGDFLFCLIDNGEIVYVGRSTKKYVNLNNHKAKEFDSVATFTCEDLGASCTSEEMYFALVFKYIPKYNNTLPKNDRYMSKGMMKTAFDMKGVEINKWIRKNKVTPIYLDYYDVKEVFLED